MRPHGLLCLIAIAVLNGRNEAGRPLMASAWHGVPGPGLQEALQVWVQLGLGAVAAHARA